MNSDQFWQFVEEDGFRHNIATAYHPEVNGEVEGLLLQIGTAYLRAKPGKWREEIINCI